MEQIEVVIGIDVGKKGAICYYFPDGTLKYYTMPMLGKEYDISALNQMLIPASEHKVVHVGIENVHAIQGPAGGTSNFQFGLGKGILMGLVAGLGYRYTLVNPKAWQKEAWEGTTRQQDNKHTSLIAAKRLFPGDTFLATERSRVPHDGIVDAALIAYYCKLKFAS